MESYYVLAADGREYGPATMDQMVAWHREGRIAPDTMVRVAGTGAQLRARDLLGPSVVHAPPPQNRFGGPGTGPQGPVAPGFQSHGATPAPRRPTPAWVWLMVGASACMLCVGLPLASVVPAIDQVRQAISAEAPRRVADSLLGYTRRHDSKFPVFTDSTTLVDAIGSELGGGDDRRAARSFTYNTGLSGADLKRIGNPDAVWMLRDANGETCFVGGSCRPVGGSEFAEASKVAIETVSVAVAEARAVMVSLETMAIDDTDLTSVGNEDVFREMVSEGLDSDPELLKQYEFNPALFGQDGSVWTRVSWFFRRRTAEADGTFVVGTGDLKVKSMPPSEFETLRSAPRVPAPPSKGVEL